MKNGRTALVLGGGVGGVVAARELRKRLPERDRVVLVDRRPDHLFESSLLWLLVGRRDRHDVQRSLSRLADRGIELVTGEITALDAASRRITVNGEDLEGDAVVISLGAELAPDAVPGLAEAGWWRLKAPLPPRLYASLPPGARRARPVASSAYGPRR